ncbi:MAG: NAD(P)/FAD-dependent oxidoreductase [Firmicutes bacterium]|nr:NAD(P)/FAD-dependent oxidoreductase [Bacillota bacterium]
MKVAVIGGGPAGMMAAIAAAENGGEVTLFEKNEKLGKKLYISGKGRCNLTNDCLPNDFLKNIASNGKFLYGAINKFSPQDTYSFCESNGLPLKIERGNRVFPASDKSSDVIKAFSSVLSRLNVKIVLNNEIISVSPSKNGFSLTTITDILLFDKVIIATGGVTYSATGSNGDGYRFAESLGHSVVSLRPALCHMRCGGTADLEGLALKNVTVKLCDGSGSAVDGEFGEMLFTDDGISGPAVLTLSSRINRLSTDRFSISIDLKPALDSDKLDARILRDFSKSLNKDFGNSLNGLLPERLIKAVVKQCGIPFDKKVNQITAVERFSLVKTLKGLTFPFKGLDDVEHGIVTAGGVDVKEVNPSTMESKKRNGLYFAGEVLDVDAYTGGFNIQCALSTGYVAGKSAVEK